jgi:hypothetical protein
VARGHALYQCAPLPYLHRLPHHPVTAQQKPIFLEQIEASLYSRPSFRTVQFIVCIPFIAFDVVSFATSLYLM